MQSMSLLTEFGRFVRHLTRNIPLLAELSQIELSSRPVRILASVNREFERFADLLVKRLATGNFFALAQSEQHALAAKSFSVVSSSEPVWPRRSQSNLVSMKVGYCLAIFSK